MDEKHPSISQLTDCLSSSELLNICDIKGDDELQVYRLNNDKAVAWLKTKVQIMSSWSKVFYKQGLA